MDLAPLSGVTPGHTLATSPVAAPAQGDFLAFLRRSIAHVNEQQREAEAAAQAFAVGEAQSVHETIIALEKADVALRLLTQVRNKVVEAYQEIMRMQI